MHTWPHTYKFVKQPVSDLSSESKPEEKKSKEKKGQTTDKEMREIALIPFLIYIPPMVSWDEQLCVRSIGGNGWLG